MFFKKAKKTFIVMLLSLFIMPYSVLAYSDTLIPGGENIGIELHAKGVMVVGLYRIDKTYPAKDAGLMVGDVIKAINGHEVITISEMIKEIEVSHENNKVEITYERNNKTKKTILQLYQDENKVLKTGLYVKDSISGIGTLTYIDPKTSTYGALGQEIIEKTTGRILEIKNGKIYHSTVTGIEKSTNGVPGEKNAKLDYNQVEGNIKENTTSGIFGQYYGELPSKKQYKVATSSDINLGEAEILTVLDGGKVNEYKIKITKINNNPSQKVKNILFEITDQRLLDKTGGIVQGMSGSPIIQDDYIIGAVTHVVVDNPTRGYGIFITNMLEEAEN